MPDLNFQVIDAEAPAHAVAPLLIFKLAVSATPAAGPIHTVMLQCQIQIEAVRRQYNAAERDKLRDLFGESARWGQTLRNRLWTHAHVIVPGFSGHTVVDLPVTCTFDLNVAGAKYFYALEAGEIPLLFLFSGTVFYAADDGRLQVTQVPWNKEASFRLPVTAWQEMIERHYPNSAWFYLQRDVFDRLYHYKQLHGLPTWEQVMERLLAGVENGAAQL